MCPKCGSRNTWDDNFWWGCSDCSFMQNFENSVVTAVAVTESRQRTIWRIEDEAAEDD